MCNVRGILIPRKDQQTRTLYTAHNQQIELAITYPFHPLRNQKVTGYWKHLLQKEEHYRVLTTDNVETLIPVWMFDSGCFDASLVDQPVIELSSLINLQQVVDSAMSSLSIDKNTQRTSDERTTKSANAVCPTGKSRKTTPRGGNRRRA